MKITTRILIAALAITVVAGGQASAGSKPAGSVKTLSGTDLGSGR